MTTSLKIRQYLLLGLCFIFSACATHPKHTDDLDKNLIAAKHVETAQEMIEQNNFIQAEQELELALQCNVKTPGILQTLEKLQKRKRAEDLYKEAKEKIKQNKFNAAERYLLESLKLYPGYSAATELLGNLKIAQNTEPTYTDKLVSFEFQDMQIGDMFTALASVANVNMLIDDSVDRTRLVTAKIDNANITDVMNSLAASHSLMLVNIRPNTMILSQDTPINRERYARENVGLFVLKYADADILRKILEPITGNAVILADKRTNSIVVRTTEDKMPLVEKLVNALDIRESEVLIEVEILEITRNKFINLGLDLGNNPVIRADLSGNVKNAGQPGTFSMSQLRHLGSGQVFLTLPSVYMNLLKKDSHTRILANPRLRIVNRTPARLHIGEKIPIKMTSSLFRDSSEELSSYEYRDVGIVLNLTPRILSETELSIDLKLEVSSIIQASEDGHPTIGTREVETTLRLQDGQVEVIAGLLKDEERKRTNKIPLLGDVPVLGSLFASKNDQVTQTDIVISLTPHIVDRRIMTAQERSLWKGYGQNNRYNSGSKHQYNSVVPTLSTKVLSDEDDLTESGSTQTKNVDDSSDTDRTHTTKIAVDPDQNNISVGETSEIKIVISEAVNVGSVPFYIDYDPNIIDIISVKEGSFMSSDGAPTAFMSSIHKQRGRIIIGLSRVGAVGGISGSGTLLDIILSGVQEGNSPLAFSHEQVLGPAAEIIPALFKGGTIEVSASIKH